MTTTLPAETGTEERAQAAAGRETAKRAAMVQGLRDLADWLEANQQIPLPHEFAANSFGDLGEIRAAMHLTGPWIKDYVGEWACYRRRFGDCVRLDLNVSRDQVCRKVQTGVKRVAAHDEPVFEWQCGPTEDDDSAETDVPELA